MSCKDDATPLATPSIISITDPAVRALLPRYLERRRADAARISEYLAVKNFADIRVLAHNMRGSGAAYGIELITAIGKSIEHAARNGDVQGIEEATRQLVQFLHSTVTD